MQKRIKNKKSITATAVPVAIREPQTIATVEQIHDDFFSSGDKVLAEALKVLEESKGKDLQSANVLMRYGFTKTKVVKEVQETQRQIAMNRPLAERIKYYQQTYPHHKFITHEEAIRICEKYSLVFGSAEDFIGDIPKKNIADIINFKIKDEDTLMFTSSYQNSASFHPSHSSTTLVDVKRLIDEYKGFDGTTAEQLAQDKKSMLTELNEDGKMHYYPHSSSYYAPKVSICAPEKDFDMRGKMVQNNVIMERPSPPDPVVLYPVQFGYLIITAWGKEASDESVMNPVNN